MIRVCGVFGTWQLVTLVAALRQANLDRGAPERSGDDYLVVYETRGVPQEFKEVLDRMARAAWPWKRIVWAYDLVLDRSRLTPREFSRTLDVIRERVGDLPPVDELWVCYLTRSAERLLFEAYPEARIVLYEDGLISYIPVRAPGESFSYDPPRSPRQRVGDWFRARRNPSSPYARFRYSGKALNREHLSRASVAYLQLDAAEPLPEALAAIPRRSVDYDRLGSVLEEVALELEDELAPALPVAGDSQAPRLLVLGQALSRNGTIPRESELALYRSVVGKVLAHGYRILWKEHPRVSDPFFDELQAHAEALGAGDRIESLRLPHAYPIELVAPRLDLAGCVVGTSAAPFYLRRLYGIACYTFSDDLLPAMQGVDVFMNRMVRREVAPLSELGPSEPDRKGAARSAFVEETA